MDDTITHRGEPRPGEPAQNPDRAHDDAPGHGASDGEDMPTGSDAERQGHDTAPPESAGRQRARLETHLRAHGSISTPEGRDDLGIMHPAARIQELRDTGHDIVTVRTWHTDATGRRHRVARYHWRGEART